MTSGLEHGESQLLNCNSLGDCAVTLSDVSISAHTVVSFSSFWPLLRENILGQRLVRGERSPEIRSAASAAAAFQTYFKAYVQFEAAVVGSASGPHCYRMKMHIYAEGVAAFGINRPEMPRT